MMQPVVIRLPQEEKRLLELEAKKEGKSFAEITRRALKAYLKYKPQKDSGVEVMLKWATKARQYKSHSKETDISTNYKKYLYGPKSAEWGNLWKKKK